MSIGTILLVVLVIIVVGLIVGIIFKYFPIIPVEFKYLILILCFVCLLTWILGMFGVFHTVLNTRI
jgi:hypothetical protein